MHIKRCFKNNISTSQEGSSEFDQFQAAGGGKKGLFSPPCRIISDFRPKSGTPFLTLFKKFSKIFLDFLKNFFWDRSNFFNGFSNFLKFAPNNFCRNYKEKNFQIFFSKKWISERLHGPRKPKKYFWKAKKFFENFRKKNFENSF